SIIHWKQNHYAAILEEKNGRYLVVDPTFGKPRWIKLADIQEEASGAFIVAKGSLPKSWRLLTTSETDQIFGQGFATGIGDGDDGCGNGSGGSDPDTCCTAPPPPPSKGNPPPLPGPNRPAPNSRGGCSDCLRGQGGGANGGGGGG